MVLREAAIFGNTLWVVYTLDLVFHLVYWQEIVTSFGTKDKEPNGLVDLDGVK